MIGVLHCCYLKNDGSEKKGFLALQIFFFFLSSNVSTKVCPYLILQSKDFPIYLWYFNFLLPGRTKILFRRLFFFSFPPDFYSIILL